MREIDRLTVERYATPSLLLMETAANATARCLATHFADGLAGKTVQMLCGQGNNGGDGAALARILWTQGAHVDVVFFGRVEETKGDARVNFEIVRRLASFEAGSKNQPSPLTFIECEELDGWERLASARHHYDIIVDALFGTGLTRPLAGLHTQIVAHLELLRAARLHARHTRPLIVSIDLPSGLDADQPELIGAAVRADTTVTFTAPKAANALPPASLLNGALFVADIGSPPSLVEASTSKLFLAEETDARLWLEATRYAHGSYKNTHGHALIIAGSRGMTGAAVLCANAAMRSGAGLVTVATPASALAGVASRVLASVMASPLPETLKGAAGDGAFDEVARLSERANVIAIGPGLTSETEETRRFVRETVKRRRVPIIIDADGLNALAPWPVELRGTPEAPLIVTPHEGELRRLLNMDARDALVDRVCVVSEFSSAHQLIVVLKGTRTLVAAPDGRVFVIPTGNAGLGTAGSGDTLTGLIAGFNAQAFATLKTDADPIAATIAAVYVGGLAGDIAARAQGMRALVASDFPEYYGAAIRALDAEGEQP